LCGALCATGARAEPKPCGAVCGMIGAAGATAGAVRICEGAGRMSFSVGWLRRLYLGERKARRSVVFTSASVMRSACFGVNSRVAVW